MGHLLCGAPLLHATGLLQSLLTWGLFCSGDIHTHALVYSSYFEPVVFDIPSLMMPLLKTTNGAVVHIKYAAHISTGMTLFKVSKSPGKFESFIPVSTRNGFDTLVKCNMFLLISVLFM